MEIILKPDQNLLIESLGKYIKINLNVFIKYIKRNKFFYRLIKKNIKSKNNFLLVHKSLKKMYCTLASFTNFNFVTNNNYLVDLNKASQQNIKNKKCTINNEIYRTEIIFRLHSIVAFFDINLIELLSIQKIKLSNLQIMDITNLISYYSYVVEELFKYVGLISSMNIVNKYIGNKIIH